MKISTPPRFLLNDMQKDGYYEILISKVAAVKTAIQVIRPSENINCPKSV